MSFTSTDIEKSLSSLGLGNGDVLFCHSNLSLFGNMYECEDKEHYCKNFLDAILNVIGDDGTLIVPTYTYSFFNNQAYDSITSSHKMGIFAEYVRQHVSSRRNDDPCFSVSILGRLRNDFIACSSSDTFGPRSVYEKLIAEDGKIVNFNMGPSSALIHYVEKLNVVKYRSDRTFKGMIMKNGSPIESNQIVYARSLNDPMDENDFGIFNQISLLSGLANRVELGRGYISSIKAQTVSSLIKIGLTIDPNFLTKRGNPNKARQILNALVSHEHMLPDKA